jgi:hypothetical protein
MGSICVTVPMNMDEAGRDDENEITCIWKVRSSCPHLPPAYARYLVVEIVYTHTLYPHTHTHVSTLTNAGTRPYARICARSHMHHTRTHAHTYTHTPPPGIHHARIYGHTHGSSCRRCLSATYKWHIAWSHATDSRQTTNRHTPE